MRKIKFTNSCDGFYQDSLDIRFTKMCDNHCPFCIEKSGRCGALTNVPKMIQATRESGKRTLLILGGEPLLLLPELFDYLQGVRGYAEKIYITTSLPYTIVEQWDLFKQIFDCIDGLNVSVQSYNWIRNNEILHATYSYNRLEILQKICLDDTDKVRVSFNLNKESIKEAADIYATLHTMYNLGVRHLKFNELQHSEKQYISFEKLMHWKLPSPYAYGCQTNIQFPDNQFSDMEILLKRACFCVEESQKATLADICKIAEKKKHPNQYVSEQLVLYEDGTLSKGWKTM